MSEKQLNLVDVRPAYRVEQEQKLMSKDALISWKEKIFKHQQRTLNTPAPQQLGLFDAPQAHCNSDLINPFELKLHNSQFYRHQEIGDAVCIYFIIDNTLPLLLYVGETKQTPKARWNSTHDCKDYIRGYIELHRKYQLDVRVCSAFWFDTPVERKSRLNLESELIDRWQSPFNKENWQRWGQPFGKI
ncbi:MAG: GIY-YIG nuclease family protein [Hydrococcus sp. SU_1_0]|nr:GIY-YIG nuclease family protein [Hydrococcus sp. SU_1_0]